MSRISKFPDSSLAGPILILVLGVPASGKTYLAGRIAAQAGMPLFSKDSFKEIIFDGLGWSDKEWSMRVGRTAFSLLDYCIERQLKAGQSLVVDTPYDPAIENEKFQRWQRQYGFRCVQIVCHADADVLIGRFAARSASCERHPGHVDGSQLDTYRKTVARGKAMPLDIKGVVIEADTTDFAGLDEPRLLAEIGAALRR